MSRFTQVVWVPIPSGNWRCRSGPTNVLEGFTERWGRTQPRDRDQPAGRNASERVQSPVTIHPAGIAARAGNEVAEPLFVGRRLLLTVDQSGVRSRQDFRGGDGSMQGQNSGITLEIRPGLLRPVVEPVAIREALEVRRDAWVGSRRGSHERRRGVTSLEQRVPTFTALTPGGSTA